MKVRNYNIFNLDPDKCVLISNIDIDRDTVQDAFVEARRLAAKWNNDAADTTKHVNLIFCQGFLSCVY